MKIKYNSAPSQRYEISGVTEKNGLRKHTIKAKNEETAKERFISAYPKEKVIIAMVTELAQHDKFEF